MTRYTFQAFTNEQYESRFIRFADGDLVRFAGRVTVEADSLSEALERAWSVGNRQEPDADGNDWPRFVRSLSVADLLVQEMPGEAPVRMVGHAVAGMGFTQELVLDLHPVEGGFRVQVLCDCGKGDLCPQFGSWSDRPLTLREFADS